MNFWGYFYLVPALLALGLSLVSWRRKLIVAGSIIFASWVVTSGVVLHRLPEETFLLYFGFDALAVEIMLFMVIHNPERWSATFLASLICQCLVHLIFWTDMVPPRRYHEIINGFYWVQILAVCVASTISLMPRRRAVRHFSPRQPHAAPRPRQRIVFQSIDPALARCPPIIRSYADPNP